MGLLTGLLDSGQYFSRVMSFLLLDLFNLGPISYLIFGLIILPFGPTVQIFVNPQLHIFLLLLDETIPPFLHQFDHILRQDTILQPTAHLIKLEFIPVFFLFSLKSFDEERCFPLLAFFFHALLLLG